jgi:translocation and assembly module TamB
LKRARSDTRRARRALVALAKALGVGAVLVPALVGGVALHLNLAAPRRFLSTQVNGLLGEVLLGKLVIQRVGVLHLDRIEGVDAQVFDPEGRLVIDAHGLSARFDTLALLRSLLRDNALTVHVSEASIDAAEVVLEENAGGELGLQRAFELRPSTPGGPSRAVEVTIDAIHIRHTWLHGSMRALPIVDADVEDLRAGFLTTPTVTEVDLKHLTIEGRGLRGASPCGALSGRLSLPEAAWPGARASAVYDGLLGAIPVHAEGTMDDDVIHGVADVPDTDPAAFAALAPGQLHLGAPLRAHVELGGTLTALEPKVWATLGAAEIVAGATVRLPDAEGASLRIDGEAQVNGLDLHALDTRAPASRLSGRIAAELLVPPDGTLAATYRIATEVGDLRGELIPATRVRGELAQGALRGSAEIAERGAPTRARFSLAPRPGGSALDQLDLQLESTISDLNAVPRLGPLARGSARVSVEGRVDLETRQLSARATAELRGLAHGGVSLSRAAVAGAVEGSLDAPRFTGSLRGSGLQAAGYHFVDVQLGARGTPEAIELSTRLGGDASAPSIQAHAHLSPRGAVLVRGAEATLARGEVTSTVKVASVRLVGGVVELDGVVVEGLGDPLLASARVSAARSALKASAADLDLGRLATLLGSDAPLHGHLALEVDAASTPRGLDGHVRAEAREIATSDVEGGRLQVLVAGEGKQLSGEIVVALGEVGSLSLSADALTLGGPVTEAASWARATGSVAIAGAIDLARLVALIPERARPPFSAAGALTLQGKASRPSISDAPTLTLAASTSGLTLIGVQAPPRAEGDDAPAPPPWRSEGLDLTLGLTLGGAKDLALVAATLHDAHGVLASIDAGATLPIASLVHDPTTLGARLRELPLTARVVVPLRSLDALPPAFGHLPLRGTIALDAAVTGSLRAPKIDLTVKGADLRARGAAACVPVVALEARALFEGRAAELRVHASREGHEILRSEALRVNLNLAEALAGDALDWDASGKIALDAFPLELAGVYLERPVSGEIGGTIAVEGLHRAAGLDADLTVRALSLDHALFPTGKLKVTLKEGALGAALRLDQHDGFAEIRLTGAMHWGAALTPSLDLEQPVDAVIAARNFRADAAMPFVRGVFTELDGRVDTDAKLHVAPGGKDGSLDGAIVIRDGVLELPEVGERFHALQGRVIMKPWGTLRFEAFSAEGPTGKVSASGEAVLGGLSLQRADARVRIARAEGLPLVFDGAPIGRAYGSIDAHAQRTPDGEGLDVTVDVPTFHLELPQSTGHDVQPLALDETVRVGLRAKDTRVTIPLAAPTPAPVASKQKIRIAVTLGRDVGVKRDTTIDIAAQGKALIEIAQSTRVSGQIRLSQGKLEIQGKQFILDRGTVTFVGADPADPQVIATAYWDAPAGIRVFADFSGHVSTGKLTLRAEPSLTQDEILALILFGSPDGTFGAAPSGGEAASAGLKAAGFAGGVITQGLNKAISDLTSVDITTRLDTSEADNPRPELAVQISKKVSARLSYKLGVPAPGDNPDRTELTLGWRFVRNWSLEAVVGDQGSTALDVVWRLRY